MGSVLSTFDKSAFLLSTGGEFLSPSAIDAGWGDGHNPCADPRIEWWSSDAGPAMERWNPISPVHSQAHCH